MCVKNYPLVCPVSTALVAGSLSTLFKQSQIRRPYADSCPSYMTKVYIESCMVQETKEKGTQLSAVNDLTTINILKHFVVVLQPRRYSPGQRPTSLHLPAQP